MQVFQVMEYLIQSKDSFKLATLPILMEGIMSYDPVAWALKKAKTNLGSLRVVVYKIIRRLIISLLL
jgi:hypothetical protein